jgi:NAD(P)-dependent dehydrogenase (short-subunit alcohol dehydrogenase family)
MTLARRCECPFHRSFGVSLISAALVRREGAAQTSAIENLTGGYDKAQRLLSEMAEHVPIGRVAPDEIAKAVVYLASDDASYVNGAELVR